MQAPRARWSDVIFHRPPSLRLRRVLPAATHSPVAIASSARPVHRCRLGLGHKEIELAVTGLTMLHTCLMLCNGNHRKARLDRHRAQDDVRADTSATGGDSPSSSSPPHDPPFPDRQLHQGAVKLADDQSDLVTMAIAPGNNNRFPVTVMKSISNNRLTRLRAAL